MKKILTLLMVGAFALTASAQQKTVNGAKFTDNWSIGLLGGGIAPTTGYHYWKNTRAIYGVELTKQITPVFALGFEGLAGNNWNKSRTVLDASTLSLLAKINATNLFCGYKGKPRLFEVEAVAGAGWLHYFFNTQEGVNPQADWNEMAAKFGLNLNFNLGEKRAWTVALKPAIVYALCNHEARQQHDAFDVRTSGIEMLAGVTYHFKNSNGKHYFTEARLYNQAEVDALNAKVNGLRSDLSDRDRVIAGKDAEIADLKRRLHDCESRPAEVKVVEKVVENNTNSASMEQTITFRQGKSTVDPAQLPNVERVATFLKNHSDATVSIKGYASPEGTANINARLARERAEAVKEILVNKYHIAASRISAEGQGVGNMFSEPDWNRVSICTLSESK